MRSLLIALIVCGSTRAEAMAQIFGVAAAEREIVCFSAGRALPAGTRLVVLSGSSGRTPARVKKPIRACDVLERALVPGPYYVLDVDRSRIEFPAVLAADRTARYTATSCASSEGIHFNVRKGRRRVWHLYWYAGYDLEPTCRDSEVKPLDTRR